MSGSALSAFHRGETGEARRLALLSLADGDPATRIAALCMLARIALRDGDLDEAAARSSEAADLAAGAEAALQQEPLHLAAAVARLQGDLETARRRYLASIELNLGLGLLGPVAVEQRNLGYVELHLGRTDEAEGRFAEAQRLRDAIGSPADLAGRLLDQAVVAERHGDPVRAADLLRRLRDHLLEAGRVPDPDEVQEMATLQRRLDIG